MITREVRRERTRIGFEIEDLSTGRKGWLAHVNQPSGPRISKYRVNLRDLEEIGASAILNAIMQADTIVVDEIGPMELFSDSFRDSVMKAINSAKVVLGTIHYRAKGSFITSIKEREEVEIIEVTIRNREELPRAIVEKINQMLKTKS